MAADGSVPAHSVATHGQIEEVIRGLARSLDFRLEIPGTHYSGLTNQQLLDVRIREGRPFDANNATLRRHVGTFLRLALEGARRMPSDAEFEHLMQAAVLEWIIARIDYKVRDVRIRLLTNAYQKRKRAAGFSGPPGVRTGAWLDAVHRARVVIQ